MDDLGLQGKIALVTGAAQGIGAAVVRALAEHGVTVNALDRQVDKLHSLVADLNDRDRQAVAFPADVRDSSAIDAVVSEIERDLGPIGILVNVAGVLRTGPIA
ncbi:MAG: SDR family NAD(P)-dependent oxidoreductase, partial [Chloroflexi bacterium]|nr:SDR family NAD(P)-dependent oxidoreductase [Chloroflexota bacterium]